jgi:hypothetical protein
MTYKYRGQIPVSAKLAFCIHREEWKWSAVTFVFVVGNCLAAKHNDSAEHCPLPNVYLFYINVKLYIFHSIK